MIDGRVGIRGVVLLAVCAAAALERAKAVMGGDVVTSLLVFEWGSYCFETSLHATFLRL